MGEKHPLSGRKHSRKGYLESAGPPQCGSQTPSYLSPGELSFCHVQRYLRMHICSGFMMQPGCQACSLPKKNHTEENPPDLQIPPFTLQTRKQAEQEGAYASSSDKSVTGRPGTVMASPHSASVGHTELPSQLGTRSAQGTREAAMSTWPADAHSQQDSIPCVEVPELPEGKDTL